MENYNMIIAGVIGSAITLLLTAFVDYLKERYRAKIEIQKLLFQRKAEAGVLVVRFSADSDCACQSVASYTNNIIITALHHGSEANQNVYNDIQGNDIIWVRSDRKSSTRPCTSFKNQANRYCLACRNHNFKTELHFEYRGNHWQNITENQCNC